ncbi:MAG TPA: hypothetical protein PKY30_23275, partial [Myxococcota bacterium]|nr:hypothetical protein [Myxococcota bacterium]
MSVLLFSLLAGCISTQPHAPFSFGWATEAYFLEAGSNSPDRGTAILILLDGAELDCDRLKEAATLEPGQTSTGALEAAAIQTVGGTPGEGLLFSMSYVVVAKNTSSDETRSSIVNT